MQVAPRRPAADEVSLWIASRLPRRRAVRRLASSLNALRSTGDSVGVTSVGAVGNGTTFSGCGGSRSSRNTGGSARGGAEANDEGAARSFESSSMRGTSRQTPKPR
jgi:hypothetical protein